MSNEKINEQNEITVSWTDDGGVEIRGREDDVKKVALILGESFYNDGNFREEDVRKIIDIGAILYRCDDLSADEKEITKKFLAVGESRHDDQASVYLAEMQDNPLIGEVMWLRAADRGAGLLPDDLGKSYTEQMVYWKKKIAEAEGKSFDGEAPTDEEFFESPRLTFFNVYKRALDGDLDAMKICLEFCEKEATYWEDKF